MYAVRFASFWGLPTSCTVLEEGATLVIFLKYIISYVFLVVGKFILFPFDNFVIYNQVEKKEK